MEKNVRRAHTTGTRSQWHRHTHPVGSPIRFSLGYVLESSDRQTRRMIQRPISDERIDAYNLFRSCPRRAGVWVGLFLFESVAAWDFVTTDCRAGAPCGSKVHVFIINRPIRGEIRCEFQTSHNFHRTASDTYGSCELGVTDVRFGILTPGLG